MMRAMAGKRSFQAKFISILLVSIVVVPAVRPLTAAAGSSEDSTNFRESVFACEEALGKLEDCCAGFDVSRVRCQHYEFEESGCDGSRASKSEAPALDVQETQCILQRDCGDLRTRGTCQRAQKATAERRQSSVTGGVPGSASSSVQTQAAVCP